MALKTSHKWIIAVVAIIILLVIAWFIYKSIPHEQGGGAPPVDTTTTNPGLAELAAGFLGGAWLGGIKNLLGGGKPKVDPCATVTCNPNKPGFDMNDLYDNCCA